jgi:hypothetical protein
MELNSTGQVSSLIPEATRPNAPARAQPEAVAAPASAGGAPVSEPSAVVVDVAADFGAGNDDPKPEPKEAVTSVDITV